MKIAILSGIFPPDIGGPAVYVERLASDFLNRGVSVKVLAYSDKSIPVKDYKFPVVLVSRKYPKIIRHFLYLIKALKIAADSDVIYAQNLFNAGIPALIAGTILRKKLVVKIVGDYAWEQAITKWGVKDQIDDFQEKNYFFPVNLLKKTQAFLAKRAFRIITPSFYLKGIIKGWGVKDGNIKVVYNAVESQSQSQSIASKEEAKNKIGIKGDIILSVGRLSPWKGFDCLIEVFPYLLKENPNFKLVIAGEGEERKNLEFKIKNLKLGNNVKLAGKVLHKDIYFYFKAADIFILNSGYEGLSHALLEAMQSGVPIIASNIGGNPELIQDGFNGFLAEYNNKEQIKNSVLRLWKDNDIKRRFIENSNEKLKEFDWEQLLEKTLKNLKTDSEL
jgi:glycosyltransferase involved in cell wall biosynthesis